MSRLKTLDAEAIGHYGVGFILTPDYDLTLKGEASLYFL